MLKKIYIAGQQGMVGSSIMKLLKKTKFNILQCKRKDLDLTNQNQVEKWFKKNKPDIVINAAGRVGGILDNSKFIDEYLYTNTMIGFNLLNCANKYGVKRFINLVQHAFILEKLDNQSKKVIFYLLS